MTDPRETLAHEALEHTLAVSCAQQAIDSGDYEPEDLRSLEDSRAYLSNTAPALARAVIGLTDKVERMKALAANLDVASLWVINHPDADNDLKAHAHADRDLAARILVILNGETND